MEEEENRFKKRRDGRIRIAMRGSERKDRKKKR